METKRTQLNELCVAYKKEEITKEEFNKKTQEILCPPKVEDGELIKEEDTKDE